MKTRLSCSGNSVIKTLMLCEKGLFQVDFYRAQPNTLGIHLLVRTGSAEHNTWLASLAISKGMRIKYSEGLTKVGSVIAGKTEQSVFEALGCLTPCLMSERLLTINPFGCLLLKKSKAGRLTRAISFSVGEKLESRKL